MKTLKRHPLQLLLVGLAVLAVTAGAWGTLLAAGPGDKGPTPTATALPSPDDAPVGDDWPRHPLPTPTPAPPLPQFSRSATVTALDNAKPRFYGELGDFVVAPPGDDRMVEKCPKGGVTVRDATALVQGSELYFTLPDYKFAWAIVCEGRVVSVAAEGGKGAVARGYLAPSAKVFVGYGAPRERIQLVTVAGKPAIQKLPVLGTMTQDSNVVVIQRHPNPAGPPGIFVQVQTTHEGAEYVQRIAEQIMAQGPR